MELAKIFSDGMVLQRNKPIKVFGKGKGSVKVSFLGNEVSLISNNDDWLIELPSHPEGGPYIMNVYMNEQCITLKDIWIGEVWITSGQSNMAYKFERLELERGIVLHNLEVNQKVHYFEPAINERLEYSEENSGWISCTKENILNKYAMLPYYFALQLQNKLGDVHVAVVNVSRGWTRIESWIPAEYIDGTALDLDRSIKNLFKESDIPNGKLFEGFVRNFVPFSVNGLVWYQGESNRGLQETEYYFDLLKILVESWRKEFINDMPVLLVQLASYGLGMNKGVTIEEKCRYPENGIECCWAVLREKQLLASQKIHNVYMVTTLDTGEFEEIHPLGKDIIAERLSIVANNICSHVNEEYSGPIFEKAIINNNQVIVRFSHADGLYAKSDLDFLAICGEDGVYYPANYQIVNNELVIYHENVLCPKAIKYAFCNWATGGLFNKQGLPASPFRKVLISK